MQLHYSILSQLQASCPVSISVPLVKWHRAQSWDPLFFNWLAFSTAHTSSLTICSTTLMPWLRIFIPSIDFHQHPHHHPQHLHNNPHNYHHLHKYAYHSLTRPPQDEKNSHSSRSFPYPLSLHCMARHNAYIPRHDTQPPSENHSSHSHTDGRQHADDHPHSQDVSQHAHSHPHPHNTPQHACSDPRVHNGPQRAHAQTYTLTTGPNAATPVIRICTRTPQDPTSTSK